jgi:hypothetical protein
MRNRLRNVDGMGRCRQVHADRCLTSTTHPFNLRHRRRASVRVGIRARECAVKQHRTVRALCERSQMHTHQAVPHAPRTSGGVRMHVRATRPDRFKVGTNLNKPSAAAQAWAKVRTCIPGKRRLRIKLP